MLVILQAVGTFFPSRLVFIIKTNHYSGYYFLPVAEHYSSFGALCSNPLVAGLHYAVGMLSL